MARKKEQGQTPRAGMSFKTRLGGQYEKDSAKNEVLLQRTRQVDITEDKTQEAETAQGVVAPAEKGPDQC